MDPAAGAVILANPRAVVVVRFLGGRRLLLAAAASWPTVSAAVVESSSRVARPVGAFGYIRRPGGRTWWAHRTFARINIRRISLKNWLEELMNVKGIGEKSFLKLKPLIVVQAKPEKVGQ